MRSLLNFTIKEFKESYRSGKTVFLGILFVVFGIMNPAIAKLTPWLLEVLSDSLAESGMTVTEVQVDAITSWVQFFKNIPIALIVFCLMYGGIFTKEYETGTLILVLTKGFSRYKVVIAKVFIMMFMWSVGYYVCYFVTYAYNAYFWDNSVATGLIPSAIYWWLFGIWVISLIVMFSVISSNTSGVLLGTGGVTLLSYLLSLIPKVTVYTPTNLMNTGLLLVGKETSSAYLKSVIVALITTIVFIGLSLSLINKKKL